PSKTAPEPVKRDRVPPIEMPCVPVLLLHVVCLSARHRPSVPSSPSLLRKLSRAISPKRGRASECVVSSSLHTLSLQVLRLYFAGQSRLVSAAAALCALLAAPSRRRLRRGDRPVPRRAPRRQRAASPSTASQSLSTGNSYVLKVASSSSPPF